MGHKPILVLSAGAFVHDFAVELASALAHCLDCNFLFVLDCLCCVCGWMGGLSTCTCTYWGVIRLLFAYSFVVLFIYALMF